MKGREIPPGTVLQRAIAGLEHDDPEVYEQAVVDLLRHGPLLVSDTTLRRPQDDHPTNVRAELLAFLRSTVNGNPGGVGHISLHHGVTFTPRKVGRRVRYEVDGALRDLVILQVEHLVQLVGLPNVRTCQLPECGRLFIKTYRRKFCSETHQARAYMRERRMKERAKRERARQRKGA